MSLERVSVKKFISGLLLLSVTAAGLLAAPNMANSSDGSLASDIKVVSGSFNTCVITASAELRCWGSNKSRQNNVPKDLGHVIDATAGFSHTCAATASGQARCWGLNEGGETDVPKDLSNVRQISAGVMHTCAVNDIGVVRCWGDDPLNRLTRVPENLGGIVQIAAGSYHTCAVNQSGSVFCWGTNWYGQNNVPADLAPVRQITAGYAHTCALTMAGQVICWGDNQGGETDVPEDLDVATQISAGAGHTCAVSELGFVRCWGDDPLNRLNKVPGNLGRVNQISAGSYHTCASTETSEIRCWGTNWYGQNNVPSDLANGLSDRPNATNPCVLGEQTLDLSSSFLTDATSPLLIGSPVIGQSLKATNGTWPLGTKLCSFWIVGDRAVVASKSASYRIQSADFGNVIRYAVVGTLNGVPTLKISNSVTVTASLFTKPETPVLKTPVQVGSRISINKPNWEFGTSYTFQWIKDGQEIPGAGLSTYTPKPDEIGTSLAIRICGAKQYLSPLCLTSTSQIVQAGVINKVGSVLFVGKIANVGSTLSGATTAWMPGVTLNSNWLLDGEVIPGATRNQIVVQPNFKGKVLSYQVTASMAGYQTVTKSSLGKKVP